MRGRALQSRASRRGPLIRPARDLLPQGERGQRHDLQPLAMLQKVVQAKPAFALGRAQVSRRQDPAEPAVSRAVLRIGEHVRRAVRRRRAARRERPACLPPPPRSRARKHARARRRRAYCDRRSRSPQAQARRRARPSPRDARPRAETKNSSSPPIRRTAAQGGSPLPSPRLRGEKVAREAAG